MAAATVVMHATMLPSSHRPIGAPGDRKANQAHGCRQAARPRAAPWVAMVAPWVAVVATDGGTASARPKKSALTLKNTKWRRELGASGSTTCASCA